MRFQLDDSEYSEFRRLTFDGGRHRLFASGDVIAGDCERLCELVRKHNLVHAVICFDSPGGDAVEGLRLGRFIRKSGFDTDVRHRKFEYDKGPIAICASAAAYAYAGGIFRYYSESVGKLGLHQFAPADGASLDHEITQLFVADVVQYFSEMGVNISTFVLASRIQNSQMGWLTDQAAATLQFCNNGLNKTTSEIKVADGMYYLKLEQLTDKVTSRVLIHRVEGKTSISSGIVTNPDRTAELATSTTSSYLEFDSDDIQREVGNLGTYPDDHTLWIIRSLTQIQIDALIECNSIGTWIENSGPMRWGALLDLTSVKSSVIQFFKNT